MVFIRSSTVQKLLQQNVYLVKNLDIWSRGKQNNRLLENNRLIDQPKIID